MTGIRTLARRALTTAAALTVLAVPAALAAAPPGAAGPHPVAHVTVFGDPAFAADNSLFLAALGSPVHPGSADHLKCTKQTGSEPQTGFDAVAVNATEFSIQWDDAGFGLVPVRDVIADAAGHVNFTSSSRADAAIWHTTVGGQVVNRNGMALRLLPHGGADAVPAGGLQSGTVFVQVPC